MWRNINSECLGLCGKCFPYWAETASLYSVPENWKLGSFLNNLESEAGDRFLTLSLTLLSYK